MAGQPKFTLHTFLTHGCRHCCTACHANITTYNLAQCTSFASRQTWNSIRSGPILVPTNAVCCLPVDLSRQILTMERFLPPALYGPCWGHNMYE
jgi:hypothetical protein